MTTKAKVMARLAELGATIELSRDPITKLHGASLYTPKGVVWNGSGCHSDCSLEWGHKTLDEVWHGAWRILGYGVEPCTDDACEICHGEDDDDA